MVPAKEAVRGDAHVSGKKKNVSESSEISAVRKMAEKTFGGQSSDIARMLLLGAAGLSAVFEEPKTAISVMILVTAEAAVGFIRESCCIRASEKIAKAAEPKVQLHEEDGLKETPASDIKEGDIFEISPGGIFPCDCLIIEQHELACDESLLTGSSAPVQKTSYSGEEQKDKLGLKYVGYSGTTVLKGSAVCKAAGHGSEAFHNTSEEADRTSLLVTESRIRAERVFTAVCAAACTVTAAAFILCGKGAAPSLSLSLAAAAVCIPERLAAAAETSSSRLRKLLYRKGITVKDTAALERLGETELVLADLRGIVTDRTRCVKKVYIPADGNTEYDYSDITGKLTFGKNKDGYMAWENSALGETMICAAVCSRARRVRENLLSSRNRHSYYEGDSDDAALLALCSACGIDRELLLMNKISEQADSPAENCVSVTCRLLGGEIRIYTKGFPEDIFPICDGVYGSDEPGALAKAVKRSAEMAESGYGVIAFCVTAGNRTLFLGLAGLWSPVPCKTSEAIRAMRKMGVRTLMFTADERSTAKSAGLSAGILTEGKRCCTGKEMDAMTNEQLEAVSGAVTVFSRTEPRHKARAAALADELKMHTAASASDTAEIALLKDTKALILACDTSPENVKQQAEVILPQCCLEELTGAIKCGRTLYRALRLRACLGIETAVTILVMLLTAVLSGMNFPILPVQLLFAALLTEPASAAVLSIVPESRAKAIPAPANDDHFIGRKLLSVHFIKGILTAFSMLGCFTVLLRGAPLSFARTGMTVSLAMSRLMAVIDLCGAGKASARSAAWIAATSAALAAAVAIPVTREMFGFSALTAAAVMISLLFAVLPSLAVYLAGIITRRKR